MIHQQRTTSLAIGMILFPNLSQLDFTGPYEVFSRLLNAKIYLLAPTLDPIYSESNFPLLPNTSFEQSPILDVLFVPGGLGVNAKLEDDKFLEFLKFQGDRARYVISVSSGSLLLAISCALPMLFTTLSSMSLSNKKSPSAIVSTSKLIPFLI